MTKKLEVREKQTLIGNNECDVFLLHGGSNLSPPTPSSDEKT